MQMVGKELVLNIFHDDGVNLIVSGVNGKDCL